MKLFQTVIRCCEKQYRSVLQNKFININDVEMNDGSCCVVINNPQLIKTISQTDIQCLYIFRILFILPRVIDKIRNMYQATDFENFRSVQPCYFKWINHDPHFLTNSLTRVKGYLNIT